MSLYRRGDVGHFDCTVNGRRHRGSTGFADKRAAARFEQQERERLLLGTSYRGSLALKDIADQWFKARIAGKKSDLTVAFRLRIMLRHMDGNVSVSTIDAPMIAEAMQARRLEAVRTTKSKPVTNSTINRDLIDTTLRPILNYAADVLKLPVQRIEWKRLRLAEPPERVRAFTGAELAAFREALPPWHRPIFDFVSRYGARLQEAFFHIDALDAEAGTIALRGRKRGPDHTIPLLEEDRRALAAIAGRARDAGLSTIWFREKPPAKFSDRPRLTAVTWRAFQSAAATARTEAGLVGARPVHDLRHHAATGLLRSTGNLKAVQALLGHEDIKSSARYAHQDLDDLRAALRHTHATTEPAEPEKPSEDKAVSDG